MPWLKEKFTERRIFVEDGLKLDGRLLPGAAHGSGDEGGYLGCMISWDRNPPKRCLVAGLESQ